MATTITSSMATAVDNKSSSSLTDDVKGAKKHVDMTEHLLSFDEMKQRYKVQFNDKKPLESGGLASAAVPALQEEYGLNVLNPPKKVHPFIQYLKFLGETFNLLLLICAILGWILIPIPGNSVNPNSYISAILFAVALINAFIEFYQHQKSAALLESFLNMIPSKCTAIRDGALVNIPAATLVPGDVVFVRMGDKIPADFYVFNSVDFKVDNSSLTGEAEPQERFNQNSHQNPLEATNLAFNGTLAVSGEAYGVVVRIGDQTVLGQIANLTQGEAKRASPLSQEIDRFVSIISFFAISSAIIFFIVAILEQKGDIGPRISYALNFAIGVLVGWVPQGLPATVSMLLTLAAQRMSKKNVLVKNLQGVETLGAITLLATDKTGTLTRNQMTVTNVWTSTKLLAANVHDGSLLEEGEVIYSQQVSGATEILHISSMCARARFDRLDVPIPERPITGDATESGLLRFAGSKLGEDIDKLADMYPKVFEIPFNSENKWHMTIHKKTHAHGPLTQFMKGAPERVLRVCSHILIDGAAVEMTNEHKQAFQRAYEYMAGKGHRVLAFAQNLLDGAAFPEEFAFDKKEKNFPTTNFCFVGLTSLEDPPKHGVREAIGHCREAGVKVMMVTGDHPLTAEAIGRKINLMLSDTKEMLAKKTGRSLESIKEDEYFAIVIHGEKIDSLTEEDWDNIFSKDEIIFARTSPKHKLEIVKRAQALGHIVGVTGDGVNDSPALKKADLGIAMNISGSDVSKEAAAMILLDDNFASTVNGISEGRLIFVNLKKSIQYVVTHIIPEVVPFLLSVVVPIPVALNALQILVIDLGFEMFAALSFAFEVAENGNAMMKVPPRKPVTPETIRKLKAREARKKANSLTGDQDQETGDVVMPPFHRRFAHGCKLLFTRSFWADKFEKPDGEILVDLNLLSWAYLEVGVIQFIGAMTTFFVVLWAAKSPSTGLPFNITPSDSVTLARTSLLSKGDGNFTTATGNFLQGDELKEAYAQSQSSYYLAIMIMQMFNLFACKCRNGVPFGSYLFKNKFTIVSLFCGATFALLMVYVPPFNVAFGTSYRLSPMFWLIPMAFGFFLLAYASLRVVVRSYFKPTIYTPEIGGLNMFPTRWSTRG